VTERAGVLATVIWIASTAGGGASIIAVMVDDMRGAI